MWRARVSGPTRELRLPRARRLARWSRVGGLRARARICAQGRCVHCTPYLLPKQPCDLIVQMTDKDDIAIVAAQLADLTRHVDDLERQLKDRANDQAERAEVQQVRIDLAARELAEVSQRLQAAADALREAI